MVRAPGGWGRRVQPAPCASPSLTPAFLSLGLWNLVFLFSNLSLIFLMPFAYFFTESEGFAGSRKVSGDRPGRQQNPTPVIVPQTKSLS